MLRKLLPLALIALLVAATVVAQTAPKGSDLFEDVPAGHWADEAIGWAATNGITSGVSETEFGIDQNLTRAHMVTFLHRHHQLLTRTPPHDRVNYIDCYQSGNTIYAEWAVDLTGTSHSSIGFDVFVRNAEGRIVLDSFEAIFNPEPRVYYFVTEIFNFDQIPWQTCEWMVDE